MRPNIKTLSLLLFGLTLSGPTVAENTGAEDTPTQKEAIALQRVDKIDVKPGDKWVYEIIDDITGEKEGTITFVVTEIVGGTMSVQSTRDFNNGHPSGSSLLVFDLNWNLMEDNTWKRSPGSPLSGIKLPIDANSKWETNYRATRKPEISVKVAAYSEVKGIEDLVLPFNRSYDSFKIETNERSAAPDGTKFSTTGTIWYSPAVRA